MTNLLNKYNHEIERVAHVIVNVFTEDYLNRAGNSGVLTKDVVQQRLFRALKIRRKTRKRATKTVAANAILYLVQKNVLEDVAVSGPTAPVIRMTKSFLSFLNTFLRTNSVLSTEAGAGVLLQNFESAQETMTSTSTNTNVDTTNIETLVETVRAESARWVNNSTPGNLLGGLLAIKAFDESSGGSAGKLDWERGRYKIAANYLMSLDLVQSIPRMRVDASGNTTARNHGLWLTALGRAVAEAGQFTDTRPATETKASPCVKKRSNPMLRGDKRQPAAATPTVEKQLLAAIAELNNRLARVESAVVSSGEGSATPVAPPIVKAVPRHLSYDETFAHIVRHNLPALVWSMKSLADGTEYPENINMISADNVYKALTEYEYLIASIKKYLSGYFDDAGNGPVDIEAMSEYCLAAVEVAGNLNKYKRRMPHIATGNRSGKRTPSKTEKITHVAWNKKPVGV